LKNLTMLPKTAESGLLAGMSATLNRLQHSGSIRAFVGRNYRPLLMPEHFDQVTKQLGCCVSKA
jgi:hypothetical protein